MKIFNILFPVFFVIALGYISKRSGYISVNEKDGFKKIVFGLLFPIMVFDIMMSCQISQDTLWIVIYVFLAFIVMWFIAWMARHWTGEEYSHISSYLMLTVEGGSVALPLYLSLVGDGFASTTITFDIAGCLVGFVLVPIMVSRQSAASAEIKDIFHTIITNNFVIAVTLGLLLNLTGFYAWFVTCPIFDAYDGAMEFMTGGLSGLLLFLLGYDFSLSRDTFLPILKLSAVRIFGSVLVIIGFFVFFPHLVSQQAFLIAIIVYFMSPTGFGVPPQLTPLHQSSKDAEFCSTFVSTYMVVTLIVYAITAMIFL